jgi:hypothetical protein
MLRYGVFGTVSPYRYRGSTESSFAVRIKYIPNKSMSNRHKDGWNDLQTEIAFTDRY